MLCEDWEKWLSVKEFMRSGYKFGLCFKILGGVGCGWVRLGCMWQIQIR